MKRHGPKVTVEASCFDCEFERSTSYHCQGDSGQDVSCAYGGGSRPIGDTTWKTPTWCPLMGEALVAAGILPATEARE